SLRITMSANRPRAIVPFTLSWNSANADPLVYAATAAGAVAYAAAAASRSIGFNGAEGQSDPMAVRTFILLKRANSSGERAVTVAIAFDAANRSTSPTDAYCACP